jgi:hypothetical protein
MLMGAARDRSASVSPLHHIPAPLIIGVALES